MTARATLPVWARLPIACLLAIFSRVALTDNSTTLEEALDDGRAAAVLKSLNTGLPADYRTSEGETPLFEAVRVGDGKLAEALLD